MANEVYLAPQVEAELARKKALIRRSVEFGILDPDVGWDETQKAIIEAFSKGRIETDGSVRNIGCKCTLCGALHIMQSDVVEFWCPCMPPGMMQSSGANRVDLV